jgi:hypothetical protein
MDHVGWNLVFVFCVMVRQLPGSCPLFSRCVLVGAASGSPVLIVIEV